MSNREHPLDLYDLSKSTFTIKKAAEIINYPLEDSWKETRTQGNTTLTYIGHHVATRLLNRAFNYQWSFEILHEQVVQSLPKMLTEKKNGRSVPKKDNAGNILYQDQPPYVKVKARLTVPGLGFREQYGTKIFLGGATEQEHAFKAASSDALKKCASLFGIGLELYGIADGLMDGFIQEYADDMPEEHIQHVTEVSAPQAAPQAQTVEQPQPQGAPSVQETPAASQPVVETPVAQPQAEMAPPEPVQQPSIEQPKSGQPRQGGAVNWNPADVTALRRLKDQLGIRENSELDPYMKEFFDNPDATYSFITPVVAKDVIRFLETKAFVNDLPFDDDLGM